MRKPTARKVKKGKGVPCGKGYISPEYECKVERARKSTLIDQTSFFGANTIVRPAGSPISYYKEDHPKETWQTTEVQRKKVAELEDKIRDRPKERVHIVDKKGKVVFTNDGDETSVAIDNDVIDNKMEGTVLTHNHPVPRGYPRDHPSQKGVSFSYADIYIGCRGRAAEVRAVSPGYDHSMKPPEGGWDTDFYFDKVAPSWNKHSKRLVPKYNWKIYNKEMDSEEAVVHFVDEMWTEISKDTGMKYERKEVKR